MDGKLFEEIVGKVCSTLDLQAAISDLQRLLKSHIGIEGIFVGHHAWDEKTVYSLVYADDSRCSDLNYMRPAGDELHNYLLSDKRRELNMLSRLNDFPAMATTLASHIPASHSLYEFRVRLDGEHIGMLAFHTARPDLSEATLDLLMKIRAPIALNLVNRLSQLDVWPRSGRVRDAGAKWANDIAHVICKSAAMRRVYQMLDATAPTRNTILLTGETGVGKDVLARHIHSLSPRREKPFVHVNCGSIPESLIESEFFGHRRGSFTGADIDHVGFFEQAHQGTIFLDEVGELSLGMQTRLLHVLQNKTIRRIGGTRQIPLDFRVIAATNCDLDAMCRNGRFRQDLFFRLNCIRVEVPPLRARRDDIPLLAERLLQIAAQEQEEQDVPSIAEADMTRMVRYDWPGNIRELENCLQRSMALSHGGAFHVDVPSGFAGELPSPLCPPDSVGLSVPDSIGMRPFCAGQAGGASLQDHIRQHLEEVLRLSHGRIHGKGGAAELLDINPSTLRSRLKKMGIPFGRQTSKDSI